MLLYSEKDGQASADLGVHGGFLGPQNVDSVVVLSHANVNGNAVRQQHLVARTGVQGKAGITGKIGGSCPCNQIEIGVERVVFGEEGLPGSTL